MNSKLKKAGFSKNDPHIFLTYVEEFTEFAVPLIDRMSNSNSNTVPTVNSEQVAFHPSHHLNIQQISVD